MINSRLFISRKKNQKNIEVVSDEDEKLLIPLDEYEGGQGGEQFKNAQRACIEAFREDFPDRKPKCFIAWEFDTNKLGILITDKLWRYPEEGQE